MQLVRSSHPSSSHYVAPSNIWVFEWNVQVLHLAFFMSLCLSHTENISPESPRAARTPCEQALVDEINVSETLTPESNRFDNRTQHYSDDLNDKDVQILT
jgi:hypothetical protein